MEKLLVSFSGGETSAYMAYWLWNNKQEEYDMIFVFANTGQENEETLDFVRKCEIHFKIPIVWVEAKVFKNERKSSSFTVTNYQKASRKGEPFEEVISKYGIPNITTPHCTRELKQNPIKAYSKSIGWVGNYTAIGIRYDELGRMSGNMEKMKFYYPLIDMKITKPMVNDFWNSMPFRLELKGYQGNCMACWKKSDNKLYQIAKEKQSCFNFTNKMEQKYGEFIPNSRLKIMKSKGIEPNLPVTFFRKNRSSLDIIQESKVDFKEPKDDSVVYEDEKGIPLNLDLLDNESCDIYSNCGNDE